MPAANRCLAALSALIWVLRAAPVSGADATYFFDAARAFREGRYEAVLSLLAAGEASDESRYLGARAHAALGHYAEALTLFDATPPSFPAGVRADFDVLRAEWAAEAGHCVRLAGMDSGVEAERRARLRAECEFRAGNFATAANALASARDLSGRSLRVQALAASGQAAEASSLARALWIEAPADRDASRWADVARASPSGLELDGPEHLARAAAWLRAHRPEEAITELQDVPDNGSKALRARLWHVRGDALFKSRRRYPEATNAFARAAALGGETEDYDAFHAARALSRAGRDRAAIKAYERFARAYPKSGYKDDALYLAAWLAARERLPRASLRLQRFVASDAGRAAPGLQREALWDLAWVAIAGKNPNEALRWLDKIPDDRHADVNAQRSYWRAVSMLATGDEPRGKQAMRETVWVDPLGWYAQLAARRLIALGEEPPVPYPATTEPVSRPAVVVPADVRFYRTLGLGADAARASERWVRELQDRLSIVAAHVESGDAVRSHASAEPLLPGLLRGPVTTDNAWLWRAVFPQPYDALVRRASHDCDLPDGLIYGHMQVESRFKADAVSGADAVGLMQLLPTTAEAVGKGLGLRVDRQSLQGPEQNITLGAAYLQGLVSRYDRQFPLAIAAYNAGTKHVDTWLTRGCPCPLDSWVEDIPVQQTRNYVRRVVSAWARYRYLIQPEDPWGIALQGEVRPPSR